ncbi:MAG: hypothetical protein O9301_14070 [Leptospira sp.]|nr:hypothetical protein [Leptospira sp.]
MLIRFLVFFCFFTSIGCNEIQVGRVGDILDLLEDDGGRGAADNSTQGNRGSNSTNSNSTQGSQNLNYYGLTDSPTGTNTAGAAGTTVGNPLGY